ncbi:hypothetical protein IQ07DRAFT_535610 [Pyrenochaeta sp. DS3sAY3a]|nr:hypothetical protein IQ07DRAFT_535610 [Pyrenochaeta sp. DS3sAY3a]
MNHFRRGQVGASRGRRNGTGRGAGHSNRGREACHHYAQGKCRFGDECRFSHDLSSGAKQDRVRVQRDKRLDETAEEQFARATYSSWRSLIRRMPLSNDLHTMQSVWNGALEILDGEDRDWKQSLPKDLDNDEGLFGRQHIKDLLSKRAEPSQHVKFIEIVRSFLLVMTHSAMVDSLSVDTYVGNLYNFISGTNGTRAVPFFQHVCELVTGLRLERKQVLPLETLDTTLIAMSTTLSELLRRESRARYNEELPDLIRSLETSAHLITDTESSITSHIITTQAKNLRAVVARASGLLTEEDDTKSTADLSSALRSTYPRDIVVPGERHDNDKTDITDISIFPTREEILSDAKEFLPSTDPDEPHFLTSKLERHIDTHFRLLRHDTFGRLKEDLGGLMKSIVNDPHHHVNPRLNFHDTRTYSYPNASVTYLMLNNRAGLQVQMSFPQPQPKLRGIAVDKRKWWEETRRLEEGVLLSFIWMHNSTAEHLFFTVAGRSTDTRKENSLTHSNKTATITIKLTTQTRAAVEALLDLSRQRIRGVLLEFPNVLPATFVPVLDNLQRMQRLSRLPFREWILPDKGPPDAKLAIPPPLYARRVGFSFPLTSILKAGASPMSIQPSSSSDDPHLIAELEANTELDRGQCVALIAALTREFAMIQGPPGTGKSYLGVKLMKVLLEIKREAGLGPVIVVCFTNHALDQFLEHLIITGISRIIRVGGQSKSELLENHNLRTITATEAKSKHERWQAATAYQKLDECEEKSKRVLGRLHTIQKHMGWKQLQYHIRTRYSLIHRQFDQTDEDGFKVVGRHPFDIWMTKSVHDTPVTLPEMAPEMVNIDDIILQASRDVQSLSYVQRRILIDKWTEEITHQASEEFFEVIKDVEDVQHDLTNVHEEVNRRVLQEADVIGLTTSGLAKNISTLQHVRAKVVICEEAGEVMEPHIISALLPTVEHFIQIGDHQQLRPSINNFEDLSLESKKGTLYQLDRSQFERLSVGQRGRPCIPVAQLNVQRRMRPEVSSLIRETIYPKLIDHSSTTRLPDVVGMRKNVYWLDHDNLEAGDQADIHHNKSKSNDWEVEMVHALVRHVVRQGVYSSSDIAVLTPYTGQLQKLRTAMRNDFEIVVSDRDQDALVKDGFDAQASSEEQHIPEQSSGRKLVEKKKLSDLLRVATVDNFQGEEAKIIIVTLVRSNKEQKVGFLKTTNRINVLLSRAQHGMYLIGNTDTYSNVPMWQKVIDMLRARESVGPSLQLCCPRHPDTAIQVQKPGDFATFSPEGGCREACMDRLPDCGHRCQARCHSKAMHEVFRCEERCQRRHKFCNHACQKATCGEDCGKCTVVLDHVELPCHHIKDNVYCHLTQDLNAIRCTVVVDKTIPGCNHIVPVHCHEDVTRDGYRCPVPCTDALSCGHICPGTCGRCNVEETMQEGAVKHSKCNKVCGRRFGTCNHVCPKRCHDGTDCGLCMSNCEVACKHSRCTLRCHEACAPCIERCTWSCPHQDACTMPCSAPCNRLPCNERCTRSLPCGHRCPGLCGEDCLTEYCKECSMKLDAQVDMLEFKTFGETDLDESPVVALACGHFFTAETLDGMIGLKDVYEIDGMTGNVLGLRTISSEMAPAIPKCPHCQRPIRQYVTQRYNRLINRAVIDEMSKRFIVTGQAELRDIDARLTLEEANLEETRGNVTNSGISLLFLAENSAKKQVTEIAKRVQTRYTSCKQLRRTIVQVQKQAAERHQPAHKLYEATLHALQNADSLGIALTALTLEDPPTLVAYDHRIMLGAQMLQIKVDSLVAEDMFRILSSVRSKYGASACALILSDKSPMSSTAPLLRSCSKFISSCKEKVLPKLAVEATLYYARIARLFETSGLTDPKEREKATKYHEKAQSLLEEAIELCKRGFKDSDRLVHAINESIKLLRKEWYEEITAEELAAIKNAMVAGPHGIATHSGHWYNCINGHPFAIGECGMPMQLARCPECGERIGGQNHEAVDGVTRAVDLE